MTPSDYLVPRFILFAATLYGYVMAMTLLIRGYVPGAILHGVLGTIWLTLLVLHLRISRNARL